MLENPEVSINYSLTYREFVAGYKLGARQSVSTLAYSIFTRYLATIAAIVLSILIIFSEFDGAKAVIPRLLPAAVLLWLVPILVWRSWLASYKQLKDPKGDAAKLTFQADRKSFSRKIQDKGELTWLWSATERIVKNKHMVLIMVRKGAFIFIPRHAISDTQIKLLEEMWQQGKLAA